MDDKLRKNLENLRSEDKDLQNRVFSSLLEATVKPVDWAYEVWDELTADFTGRSGEALPGVRHGKELHLDPLRHHLKYRKKYAGVWKAR
jgi:hypothetical protein